jgi:hypothetical protein
MYFGMRFYKNIKSKFFDKKDENNKGNYPSNHPVQKFIRP